MASVDWKKIHGSGEAGAKKAHFAAELRETVDHENEHINKNLSHLNYSLGAASYAEAVELLEARTRTVDAELPPKRIRKDRVTGFSLYTVCPEEIQQAGKADEYFRKVHEAFRRIFGPENVHGSFIHKDERHEYLDTRTGEIRTSLFHAHTIVSAYVPGKGINGKLACTRSSMRTVNKALEEICREYGIEWHTGQGKESRTMDELKAASAKAERERQEELLLEPEAVREIQQRKPLLSKDEVIIKADDLAQLQQAATLAQSALEKAKKLQKERDKLRADLQAERRRAPDLIREAEEEAEQIREQAEREAARIREESAAELRRMERRQEALETRIGRLEGLLEEKEAAFDSPDKNVLKLHRIINEIAAQEERDRQALNFDRVMKYGDGIEKVLKVARDVWRQNVPPKRRTPELDTRQDRRRDWDKGDIER